MVLWECWKKLFVPHSQHDVRENLSQKKRTSYSLPAKRKQINKSEKKKKQLKLENIIINLFNLDFPWNFRFDLVPARNGRFIGLGMNDQYFCTVRPIKIFFPKAVKNKCSQSALIPSEHLRFCEGQIHWLSQQLMDFLIIHYLYCVLKSRYITIFRSITECSSK